MITPADIQELYQFESPDKISAQIWGFTFRTTKIEELTPRECERIYAVFQKELAQAENDLIDEIKRKQWKSNCIALAEKCKIKDPGDFHKFNNWMIKSSRFKKHLNAHSLAELKALHQQLCALQDNQRKAAQSVGTKAWMQRDEALIGMN